MKKLFVTLALILVLVFALAACNGGNTPGGENAGDGDHVFRNEWTFDDEKHWRSCIDLSCDARKNEAYHTFGEWVIDEEATCAKAGTKHRSCVVCGKSVSETIEPDAHNYATTWTTDGTNHWHKCQNSGCTSISDETAHSFGEWVIDVVDSCMQAGVRHHVCTICNKTVSENYADLSAHNYSITWTSDDTRHWHVCLNNGCNSVSDKTTHTFGEWIIDTAATCTTLGTRHHVCTVCNKSVSETYSDPIAHNYATTWTSDGAHHWHKCQNSGCTSVSDKTAHTFEEWIVDEAATCVSSGMRHHICTICNKSVSENYSDANAHNYATEWTTDQADHWHVCQNSGCNLVSDKTTHTWDNENTCTVCQRYKDDGVKFYKLFKGTYVVSDYTGSASEVIIPSTYKGVAVTSIYSEAFYMYDRLTSITIPDSVTSIDNEAFFQCRNLTSVTVPDSVTSIGDDAFANCFSLTSVTFGENSKLKSIGFSAFSNCTSLTSITIPDSVTSIKNGAFGGCSSLTSITLPDSVTSICDNAFRGCSSLTSITIPDSVKSIGWNAFSYCTSLTSITISKRVNDIGYGAFINCTNLASVTYDGTKAEWENITKGDKWLYNTPTITVHCTDGDIVIDN